MMRFRYVRYCTLSEVRDYWRTKAGGDAKKSENGRGAWVAISDHPTDTDKYEPTITSWNNAWLCYNTIHSLITRLLTLCL
jgi:hypothetical protein